MTSQCLIVLVSEKMDEEELKKALIRLKWVKEVHFERWIFNPKKMGNHHQSGK